MMTKAQKVAVIWADWNEDKITSSDAIYQVGKLFPRAKMTEWRKRMSQRETPKLLEAKA